MPRKPLLNRYQLAIGLLLGGRGDIVDTDRAFLEVEILAAMAGIARKIELYNSAYQLAWERISEHQKREQPDIARRLDESIRRHVSEGATEAVFIASEALTDIEKAGDTASTSRA